jgi:peptidoglycan/LPS O-acetylase OafA/YrhL
MRALVESVAIDSGSGVVAPNKRSSGRLAYFDGLRGWAALAVVIFHSTHEVFGVAVPALAHSRQLLNDGALAVPVFFVLSGFVLSRPHLPSPQPDRVRAMAIARYARLTIPIAVASLLSLILLASGAMFNREADQAIQSPWLGSWLQFSPSLWRCLKFAFFDVYFQFNLSSAYDFVLWTMPIELAGSFLIFALITLFAVGPRLKVLSCVAAVAIFSNLGQIYLTFVFGYLLANLHSLMEGRSIKPGATGNVVGILLVVFAAYYRLDHDGYRSDAAIAACLVLAPVMSPLLQRLLSAPLSTWLGRISFPLYLTHSLVLYSLSSFLIVKLHEISWPPSWIAALVVPTSIAVSLAVAHLFEPVERFAIQTSRRLANFLLEADTATR